MNAVEFTADLSASPMLQIPPEAADKLPKSGRARIIVLTEKEVDPTHRFVAAYQEFMHDETP